MGRLFFMKYFAEHKSEKKSRSFLYVAVLTVILVLNQSIYAYANEANMPKEEVDDGIRFLEFENHALIPKKIPNFITIKNKHSELYSRVQSQMSRNAYLLDVYVPQAYEQTLDREYHENVTRVVYLYTMPVLLHEHKALQKTQVSFIKNALIRVFSRYQTLMGPTLERKKLWENKVYTLFMAGKSIYFEYPAAGEESYKYSALQTFPLSSDSYAGAFVSTYIFTRKHQIYFLSASTFLTGNNYYEELLWTRDTLDTFIKLLPEVKKEIIE